MCLTGVGSGGRSGRLPIADVAVAAVTSIPLAVQVDSASPRESQLLDETLGGSLLDEIPARLSGDKAYDSDPLDQRLKREWDIDLIAPIRENRR